ncbi:hypothetical protein [Urbifossiella limnaea]|uniref:Uncharacterized protein n=1 Tax=Urbifossiella limnaea TaxID=2528023 RepID=A0A517XQ72_9BACT|nr:hypothetical protein [Urbifossiella limnaea]QDU19642.1 hypothetical protein ETAA1_15720 [Urbifossiella limnaea]
MSSELPPAPAVPGRGVVRFLWTSNPLYVVSAGLFLYGLQTSFADPTRADDATALTAGLGGYTLLLAAAALFLVRYAGYWNDLRTVLLLVVLMFLATSVTFDELLVTSPDRGALLNGAGLVFAVVVSEVVLNGIRLRLPAGFRGPYYLTLALFFLYPVALTQAVRAPQSDALLWGLWGFAPAAGLVFLLLLPAARRGAAYARRNGSPWPWPFYPWSLFVFLAVAVCGRAFLLCWSFHLLDGAGAADLVFAPYFLAPFGLAVAAVLLELGLVARHRPTQVAALLGALALVPLSSVGVGENAVAADFLGRYADRLGGTPLYVALLAAGGFSLIAWVRKVPLAADAVTLVLLGLAVIGPDTLRLTAPRLPHVGFLAAAWAVQLGVGLWRREAWRWGLAGGMPAVWVGLEGWRLYAAARAVLAGLDQLVAGLLLLPVAVLVSLGKAGVLGRWVRSWRGEPDDLPA